MRVAVRESAACRYVEPVYATCLFCNAALGANDAIEHFPVGRRLAYDAATGRLWVVCQSCTRWNLSPLETRWEAIEEAERLFRGTKVRVSTDNIAMAELSEGTQLVRIGKPPRLEMSVWRYGHEMQKRWRRWLQLNGVGSLVMSAPIAFTVGSLAHTDSPVFWSLAGVTAVHTVGFSAKNAWLNWYNRTVPKAAVRDDNGTLLRLTNTNMDRSMLISEDGHEQLALKLTHVTAHPAGPFLRLLGNSEATSGVEHSSVLTSQTALQALSVLLPRINRFGGLEPEIEQALDVIDETPDMNQLLQRASANNASRRHRFAAETRGTTRIISAPQPVRLALEMALHEHDERRALEGELHLLEERWRDADAIAKIADNLLLPEQIPTQVQRLRGNAVNARNQQSRGNSLRGTGGSSEIDTNGNTNGTTLD